MNRAFLCALCASAFSALAAPDSHKPIVKDGMVYRTIQQDAELRDWIVGLQTENKLNGGRADKAETSEKEVRAALGQANTKADVLQAEVQKVTDYGNAQAKLKDAAMGERDYWHEKHSEAVAKLWWWRLWAGGAILVGVLLITAGLLMKFTKWGAQTIGPIVTKTFV